MIIQELVRFFFFLKKGQVETEEREEERPGVFDSVELERGWTVRGFNGHFLFADFDAHRFGRFVVARMFQKAGWSDCWCTEKERRRVRVVWRAPVAPHSSLLFSDF